MATIPIEIILQDAEAPVDPTPTPEEETNIVVPDTGTMSNVKDSGGISSSVGIILPIVIAILAIVTAIVLMMRKHHNKHFPSVMNRKEKLATVVSSAIAILAVTVLVGNLLIPATNATTEETGTTLSTPEKIQIVANRYEDVTIVASAKVISYASTDTSFGYKIFMSMAGDTANLYLDGDTSSQYYFAPTTRANLDINSWGYNFDGEADYIAMPLVDDPLMAQQSTSAAEGDEFTVYYTVKADKDMPFGVYSGEISYDIKGYNGFPEALTTMQGMTSDICAAVYTPNAFKDDGVTMEDNVPTKTLTDTRDDKTYTVSKLADGKCWMTQNLDLQAENLKQGVTLDSTNTDNPASGFTLPTSQVSGNDSWGNPSSQADIETAHVYDIAASETTYRYCIVMQYGNCIEEGDVIPAAKLGNLYNWYTATAGTGTQAIGSGGENPYEATGSICPAGWRLPNNSNNNEATDYSTLLSLYGITKSATDSSYVSIDEAAIYKAPLLLIPSGFYNDYGLIEVGKEGGLWSSMAYGRGSARLFFFEAGYVRHLSYHNKVEGQAVRCVAR